MSRIILTEIWIYPIKSLPGIQVSKGQIKQKGMDGDRRFMLVDETNTFMTQRQLPQLSQFNVSFDGKTILVKRKGSSDGLSISVFEQPSQDLKAAIWDNIVDVVEVSADYSVWFSKALDMPCRLVRFPEENERRVNPKYVPDEHHVSLADAYPYLLIGRNSLRDLNQRTPKEMVMRRFRPNLVFDGAEPYAEDSWKKFQIGDVHFSGVKMCDRCVLTTVDPETGIKGDEPLRTLSTYRKFNSKVYFGQNVIAHGNGEIHTGDEIKVG